MSPSRLRLYKFERTRWNAAAFKMTGRTLKKKRNLIVFDNAHDQEGVCDARRDFPYVKPHSMFPLLRANRF